MVRTKVKQNGSTETETAMVSFLDENLLSKRPEPDENRARLLRLRQAIKANMGRGFKPEAVVSGADIGFEYLSLGLTELDTILGGGLPRGALTEIYGPTGSGKTTLALQAVAQIQAEGGTALWIDAEHRFNPQYAQALGVDLASLLVARPTCGEDALELICQQVATDGVDIIATDSVAALTPKDQCQGDLSEASEGYHWKLMAMGLQRLASALNASHSRCVVLFLNQLRLETRIVYGSPEVATGGAALTYYASIRLELRRIQMLVKGPNGEYGIKVKAKVSKNSCAKPFQATEIDLTFGAGFQPGDGK